ncbi:MAG: winged helix-turn-helix domain-containing protein [Chloroflexi bacterium]|nr:winged helix-turn-helix domain-containing protein [Chloroflexota bacterium]
MALVNLLPQTERETLKFRLLVLLVVSVTVFFRVREVPVLPLVGLVAAYLAYSALLRLVLIPRFTSAWLLAAMLLVDASTLLAAIYLVGVSTPVIMLLTIAVVYYALYLGYTGGLVMATLVSFGFVALVYATGRLAEMANIIAIQVPSTFLLALLVGYLAQARLREGEERRTYQQLVQAETQGRRLLELAGSLAGGAGEGLAPPALAEAAASMAGMPWAAILLASPDRTSLVLAGATYPPASEAPVSAEEASAAGTAWREGREAEQLSLAEEPPPSWLPAGERPGYLWAIPLGQGPGGVLCVMGPFDARLDEREKEALRAFAPLVAHIVEVRRLFDAVERRSRDIVSELHSTVETTGRLVQVQSRRSLQFRQLTIDPQRERVRLGTTVVHLSRIEFDLLYTLAANPSSVFNVETLLQTVWGADYVPQGNPVDVAIHRLRRKLGAFSNGARLVRTVRGRGYSFDPAAAISLSQEATTPRGAD